MATYNISVKTETLGGVVQKIAIPSNVIIPTRYNNGGVIAIASNAFEDCDDLVSIKLPDNTIRIGASAFSGCTGLTSIEIPNKVVYIEASAFNGCTGLTSIKIPASVESMGANVFNGCSSTLKIKVDAPASSVSGWASGWNGGCSVEYLPEPVYKITVNKTGSGTVNVEQSATKGEEITISLTPATGYIIGSVKVDENVLEAVGGQYKFEMPNHDVKIDVIFIVVPAYVSYDNISFDTEAIKRVEPFTFGGTTRTGYVAEITVKENSAFIYTPTKISNLQYYDTRVSKWQAVASGSGWTLATATEQVTINNNTLMMYKHTYNGSSVSKLEYRFVEAN